MLKFSKNVGDLLVIQITGCIVNSIAQVVQEHPLAVKVQETGPYSNLRGDDFLIIADESQRIQDKEDGEKLIQEKLDAGWPLVSGLACFGITDGKIYEIIPS